MAFGLRLLRVRHPLKSSSRADSRYAEPALRAGARARGWREDLLRLLAQQPQLQHNPPGLSPTTARDGRNELIHPLHRSLKPLLTLLVSQAVMSHGQKEPVAREAAAAVQPNRHLELLDRF